MLSLRAYEFRLNAIELETDFEPALPPVLADGGQLQQALLNLMLNAEQAMRGADDAAAHASRARHDAGVGAVELSVTDTGHGIDDENLRRIFDPFFTTRDVGEGTGLGLSICYGIVRDHGGQITVESRVRQGTTFTILLPARPEEPERADSSAGRAPRPGRARLHRGGAARLGLSRRSTRRRAGGAGRATARPGCRRRRRSRDAAPSISRVAHAARGRQTGAGCR